MAYYDKIAKQWHKATGYEGGAFKELVLNDRMLEFIPGIAGKSILELGAGNGYFMPMVLRRFSGQRPERVVVSDISTELLAIAERHFRIPDAEYRQIDIRKPLPFEDGSFGLIWAVMVFNEVPTGDFKRALGECRRVLSGDGSLIMAVIHPAFVKSLEKRGQLAAGQGAGLTMPGAGNLRVPVVVRSLDNYRNCLTEAGFQYQEQELYPTPEVLHAKSGLKNAGKIPLALVYRCSLLYP